METKTITIKNIPTDAWIKFKASCVLENKTIEKKIVELIVSNNKNS